MKRFILLIVLACVVAGCSTAEAQRVVSYNQTLTLPQEPIIFKGNFFKSFRERRASAKQRPGILRRLLSRRISRKQPVMEYQLEPTAGTIQVESNDQPANCPNGICPNVVLESPDCWLDSVRLRRAEFVKQGRWTVGGRYPGNVTYHLVAEHGISRSKVMLMPMWRRFELHDQLHNAEG